MTDAARARARKKRYPDATPVEIAHALGLSHQQVYAALAASPKRGRPKAEKCEHCGGTGRAK